MAHPFPADLLDSFRQAKHIVALTGAGISAESGIPTFRDAQTGLWAKYDPHELASPQAFEQNPRLVWDWYLWRRSLVRQASPNPGHLALAAMQNHAPRLDLITQNIDNLHQAAGSQNVLELHGNIYRVKCYANHHAAPDDSVDTSTGIPPCPACGSLLRPDVVWFGEALPAQALAYALEAAQQCDLLISIGTSGMVYPAAQLPIIAIQSGKTVVEINPEATPLSSLATYFLQGKAGEILPQLVEAAWEEPSCKNT